MNLGVCLNCKNHEDCTFQRIFPVIECNEYEELDLNPDLAMSLKDILAEWGFTGTEEQTS